jgi:streptogramin lyase
VTVRTHQIAERRHLARLIAIVAAGLTLCAALFAPIARAEPIGQVEHFPTKCGVGTLVAGPDGNVWFTCFKEKSLFAEGRGQAMVGRITPEGKVSEFSAGIPPNRGIGSIVAGPDGNLWFTLSGAASPPSGSRPSAIGRITPGGEVTLFGSGLRARSAPGEIVSGPGGELWFADNAYGKPPEIGRITPQGAITEYPTELKAPLGLGGLAAGPDGNLWFTQVFDLPHGNGEPGSLIGRLSPSGALTAFGAAPAALGAPVAGADGNVWFVADSGHVAIGRVTPSGEISQFGSSLLGVPSDLVAGPGGNIWFTAQQSIGRVTPNGEITQYTDCMDYRQLFSEARSIVAGPGEDLWFTSVTSRELPSIEEPPTIGRVTPSGQITQFKAGIESEPRSLVAGPDGRVWFAGGGEEIERITPPSAPVNTFVFARGEAKAHGASELPVEVPGPGRIELRQLALVLPGKRTVRLPGHPTAFAAASCGQTSLKLRLRGAARARLGHHGRVELKVRATFTPTGGSPNTEVATVSLIERLADRRDRRR